MVFFLQSSGDDEDSSEEPVEAATSGIKSQESLLEAVEQSTHQDTDSTCIPLLQLVQQLLRYVI